MSPDFSKPAKPQPGGEVGRDAVMAALDEMVASETFRRTERPARFLRHLVEARLRGESHLLKESVLGTEVFERPASWDPRLDPIVRQEAGRLRKRLAAYYANGGASAVVRIELPVGSYVPVFQRISSEPIIPANRQRIWTVAIAAVLSLFALIAWRAIPQRESTPSIAVLPFANLSADPSNQYFADGLTDEITDSLAGLKSVRVIARSSAFQFKGQTKDIREVGRLLNVTNVLEGSVERSGDRVRIVAHLERVSDGSLLWSNTYERKATDLFAIQSELAAGIAGGLKVSAGPKPANHIPGPEAHDLVMKGRYALEQNTIESLAQAGLDFQRAVDLDPQYAAAYFGLGNTEYSKAGATGIYVRTIGERERAERYFHKALTLDPNLPAAHAGLARLAMQYDWDWKRAEEEIQLALAGPPTATAESAYAALLIFRGRFAEADVHLQICEDLDPFSTATMLNVANTRNLEGRFAEARERAQKLSAAYPNILPARQLIGLTYIEEGRPDLALADLEAQKQNTPFAPFREAMARARAGQREQAVRLIAPFEEKYPNAGVSMGWFALVYAFMGDQPNTLKWMERSADQHEWGILSIGIHPVYAFMQGSPGFHALKKRMGLE
jgi:TolB-like protein/Flp pilus assembly protein TadD